MVVSLPNEHQVLFYKSSDLKHWTKTSTFGPQGAVGGQWECPSLVEVPQKAGKGSVWALKVGLNPGGLQGGSGEQYFLGDFDGKAFSLASGITKQSWTDYGKDSYCAISYNHLPPGAPPVLIGWMNNWEYADKLPTSPWRGQMTIPRELHVVEDADGMSLAQTPVTKGARVKTSQPIASTLKGDALHKRLLQISSPAELHVRFSSDDSHVAGLRLYSDESHWTEIGFDLEHSTFYVDRVHSGIEVTKAFPVRTEAPLAKDRPFDVDLVLDRSSVEAFAQSGTIAMTNLIFPASPMTRVEIFRVGGTLPVTVRGEAWRLNSVWANASHP